MSRLIIINIVMNPFEDQTPIKFTQLLRDKTRKARGIQTYTDQEQIKMAAKRNIELNSSYQKVKEGLVLDYTQFNPEAEIIKRLRLAQDGNLNTLYGQLSKACLRLTKPDKPLSSDLILGRVFKFGLNKLQPQADLPPIMQRDYQAFVSDLEEKYKRKDDVDFLLGQCKYINMQREKINSIALRPDFLEQKGFSYNPQTFDDLFMNGWANLNNDLSSDEEPQDRAQEEDEQQAFDSGSDDLEHEVSSEEYFEEQKIEAVKQPEITDLEKLDPAQVNWYKYITDVHSVEMGIDGFTNLLTTLRSDKQDMEIQNEVVEACMFNMEAVELLFQKRVFIKAYCKTIMDVIESKQKTNSAQTNKHEVIHTPVGVQVQYGQQKKKGGNKKGQGIATVKDAQEKQEQYYQLLFELGFKKEQSGPIQTVVDSTGKKQAKDLKAYIDMYKHGLVDGSTEIPEFEDMNPKGKKGVPMKIEQTGSMSTAIEENDDWKHVLLTPPPKEELGKGDLVPIEDLPPFARQAFSGQKGTTHLNRIQSKVFPCAFKTSNNILIAAPTGAGKTNIALLTILREISQHVDPKAQGPWSMKEKPFKIVYIAPLKALASEITDKFKQALAYMGVKVRELTGDMSLTKQEITETHILVATPEKWDVVTRKTDGVMDLVTCLIIDEIHLLNDKRGLVLECLVSRAITTGLKMQKPIRLCGLSATLPNYHDVADFIQASEASTFAFDSSYRPTPLKCGFYGIKEMGNVDRGNQMMNDIIFENLLRIIGMGKQVIIFAHKRAETYNTAMEIIELIKKRPGTLQEFDCEDSWKVKKQVAQSKNMQLKDIFDYGFGVHHAGMLRKDRTLVEGMFRDGHIKVLCSTSTLAWGVNLPAYAVIIKGTKVYDSSAGAYKDIGVFDVQQIFGRAGRPQYDTQGEAIIITLFKQMDEYVKMMQNKQTIESHLTDSLAECINAEISAGTITTISEGVQWLKKSYFYRRLVQNPMHYGVKPVELQNDPSGHMVLLEKMTECVENLNRMRLIRYNRNTESVNSTDMGRVASNYYINCETMGYFMANFHQATRPEMILTHMAQACEFKQLDARKEEYEELKMLVGDVTIDDNVDKHSFNTAHTKVVVLFECYLKQRNLKTFSLISDLTYIVQNSARLLRAIFEIAMQKGCGELAVSTLSWCHMLEKRIMPMSHTMRQFSKDCSVGKLTNANQSITNYGYLSEEVIYHLERHNISLENMYDRDYPELTRYVKHSLQDMHKFLSYVPRFNLDIQMQPITRTILKVSLTIHAEFVWNDRWNGKQEPFWIIVENEGEILHQEYFSLQKKDVRPPGSKRTYLKNDDTTTLTFFIPYQVPEGEDRIPEETYYDLGLYSDKWYQVRHHEILQLSEIAIPDEDYPHTKLLPLRPIPISALGNPKFEELYANKFKFFNPIQTQVFHTLFHTDSNSLVGAPTGSGKTIMSELAMLRVFKEHPGKKIIYIAPLKALAKERIIDWKIRLGGDNLRKSVLELTGDVTPDLKALKDADVLITTPEKWDGISRNWQHRSYVSDVALVIIDEIHLLGCDRGPVIEVIVSRMRYISEQTGNLVRFVGLSTALANAKDVADWLGIHKLGLFNFKPSVRPVPIKVFFEGFPEKHYCPRMASMNRPAFKAINTHSRDNPVLVFVSSRRQTRLTALDLIAMSAADQQERMMANQDFSGDFKRPFLHMDPEEISALSEYIRDDNLKQTIQYGVGMHHAGLEESDRKIVEDLFVKKKIQILVTTSTLAWGVNFPARLVVVKGTEFFDPTVKRYVDFPLTDLLQMIGRAGRPGHDDQGIACVFVSEEKKNFYKKFLYEPFPVESSLANSLTDHLNAEIASGTLASRQNCIDYLTWTYFFRRLTKNPTFYNLEGGTAENIQKYLNSLVSGNLMKLKDAGCVELEADTDAIASTQLGYLCSFYYLSHMTIQHLDRSLKNDNDIESLIDILSKVQEFSGLPVRHNEDILNEALSHLVPLKVNRHMLESPFTKANLLLQAHFDRCPLPITDFITDSKSVLDQSIRVLQGMIDVATHKGFLQTTLNLIHLMQMLVQGQWLDQTPFLNVPYFNNEIISKLQMLGISHLVQLAIMNYADLKNTLVNKVKAKLNEDELQEIHRALSRVPVAKLRWSMVAVDDQTNERIEGELLEDGGEAELCVNLTRSNKAASQGVSISNFPKFKEASWFIVVANPTNSQIIVVKRVAFKRATSKSMVISLPEDLYEEVYDMYLLCDSYIGLDQVFQINFAQVNDKIGAKQGKKIEPVVKRPVVVKEKAPADNYSMFDGMTSAEENEDTYVNYSNFDNLMVSEEAKAEQHSNDHDSSFEFDVKPDDIYDLYLF